MSSQPPPLRYNFLSWVRQGATAGITKEDSLSTNIAARVELPIKLVVNGASSAEVTARLYAAGDVTGIDARQVTRTDPPHLATSFEPNYFPAVEFDRPDFPWLFTPARGNAEGRLRPWICLIVVRKQAGVTLTSDPRRPLPVLEIMPPAQPIKELPDLSESWAWAHAQVVQSSAGGPLAQSLIDSPQHHLSRLLCPRRLEANAGYYACIVPTFQIGRKTGLGEAITAEDEQRLAPAWELTGELQQITLPIYFHWEFTTAAGGDFETLVRLLAVRPLPPEVGLRDLDITDPGGGMPQLLPDAAGAIIGLEGALRTAQTRAGEWPEPARANFQQALRELLNAPAQGEEALSPPIYGRWQAAQQRVTTNSPLWLQELNLDPRYRVAAGLGAKVVRQQQEELMASAWQQLGAIEECNRRLRQAQLAREVSLAIFDKRLRRLSADHFLKITVASHTRLRLGKQTVHQIVRDSLVPEMVMSAPLRKLTRLRGPLARRLAIKGDATKFQLAERLNKAEAAAVRALPKGMVVMDAVNAARAVNFKKLTAAALKAVSAKPRFEVSSHGLIASRVTVPSAATDSTEASLFRKAAIAHQAKLISASKTSLPSRPPLAIPQIHATMLEQLNPRITILDRIRERVQAKGDIWARRDPLEPVMAQPEFPQPMYQPLCELAKEMILPGLEKIPPNTISLVQVNQRFIEAYMVGLNYEMGRELLWREYPTDQRGSYFRQFWDMSEALTPALAPQARESLKDIPPLHLWRSDKHLGENSSGAAAMGLLVILIRGELLLRYPNAVIYAVKAQWSTDKKRRELGKEERYPVVRGGLPPDTAFLGFNLSAQEACGSTDPGKAPGWFFVFQQQPGEPRFGLDEVDQATPRFGGLPISRNDLTWGDLVTNEQQYRALTHAHALGRLAGRKIEGATWGSNAAHLAYLTLQKSARIAIHADALLPLANR